ncbi:TPA: hypothetical protein QDB28_004076 [Burkholderia vietnamiensis]|nr:hypothetical protein [Burkholderia vietnamiensis]
MATKKRHVPIPCYGSRNSIDIYRTDRPEDGFEFQLYLNAAQKADTLMTREQLVKLRDAIDGILISHLSEPPQGSRLAGWHPTEDCFAVLMPDGSARLYINGSEIPDAAPLHTVSDLARMDQDEYRATVDRITSGQVSLQGKQDGRIS